MHKSICLCASLSLLCTYSASSLAQAATTKHGLQSASSPNKFAAQSNVLQKYKTKTLLAQSPSKAPQAPAEKAPDCRTLVLLNYKLRQRGDYQSAEKVLQAAMKSANTDADKILVHNAFGGLYMQTQNDIESEANFRKALALLEKTAKPDSLDMAAILDNLSVVCSSAKKLGEAEALNGRAIAIYRKNKDAPNATMDLITVLGNRGYILSRQGKHKESLETYEEAVAICRSGEQVPPSLYATMMDNLGSAYFHQGEFEKAEHARVDALALFESSQGQNHPETVKARHNLASVYIKEGRLEEAADLLKKSIETLKSSGTVYKNLLNSCLSDYEYCQIKLAAKKIMQDQRTKQAEQAANSTEKPESKPSTEDVRVRETKTADDTKRDEKEFQTSSKSEPETKEKESK